MYIKKIKNFYSLYENYDIEDFLKILENSNKLWFDRIKFE